MALQKTFASLQFGGRRFASTLLFVDALQLPRSVQQDAEEFHKVLLSLLHDRFVLSVPAVRHIIPQTFAGALAYKTTCCVDDSHVCWTKSEEFYELVSPRWVSLVCVGACGGTGLCRAGLGATCVAVL